MTHAGNEQRMSPLKKWLTACSYTPVIPQHNTGLHTYKHRNMWHLSFELLSNTPSLSISHKHRITQCVALRWRHQASIVLWPEEEQGSSLGEARGCERGNARREGWGISTSFWGEWTARQAISRLRHHLSSCRFPSTLANHNTASPDQLRMS